MTETGYTPVDFVYREAVEAAIAQQQYGRIFYFDDHDRLESADGIVVKLQEEQTGWWIELNTTARIKLHRVITLFGKPGPAYDEYDLYSIRCGECAE